MSRFTPPRYTPPRLNPPSPNSSRLRPPGSPPPPPPVRPVALVLKLLSVLVALSGLLMTFFLARSGHDTAGLVAVLSALAPLLVVMARSR